MSGGRLDPYFGCCSRCERPADEILHVGRVHYAACHSCRECWTLGSNLFSDWQETSPADHFANYLRLREYERSRPTA